MPKVASLLLLAPQWHLNLRHLKRRVAGMNGPSLPEGGSWAMRAWYGGQHVLALLEVSTLPLSAGIAPRFTVLGPQHVC